MQEVNELRFKNNLLRAMASVADAEIARKSAQLNQTNDDIVRKDDLIIRITQDCVLKDQNIARLEEDNIAKDKQIAILTNENEEKDRRLSAMLASTSWRLTAILRWLGRSFRNANDG